MQNLTRWQAICLERRDQETRFERCILHGWQCLAFRAVIKAICDDEYHDVLLASGSLKTMATDYRHRWTASSSLACYAVVSDAASNLLDSLDSTSYGSMNHG